MKNSILLYFLLLSTLCFGQGKNHNWLVGYDVALFDTNVTSTKGILKYDTSSINVIPTNFKIPFRAAQGNISDENGNLLMVSNGCWIANSTGDTMQNGGGLNPSPFTTSWCDNASGIPYPHTSLILPYPADSNKFLLFHQTGTDNVNTKPSALFYTVIDMNLDNGLGGVIAGKKNKIAIQASLNPELAACKHANGRDWWIIAFKDSTDIVYKVLLTSNGIASVSQQSLGVPLHYNYMGQAQFSPDGNKFAYHYRDFVNNGPPVTHQIRLFDFDRCSGMFSNPNVIAYTDSVSGNGLAFSSNSRYLYFTLFNKVMQLYTDTTNILASLTTVAIYDGFAAPYWYLKTDFWLMYLAANGKIYISSGNSVVDLHYINYPDSGGMACDVQQHALHLPCYSGRGNVYHPNYYLGRIVGSPCDTLQWTGIDEQQHDFHFSVSPNPSNGSFKIMYLLPQNSKRVFEMFDVEGRKVFSYNLPQWSTLQNFDLKNLNNGVYYCVLHSGNERVSKKMVVIKQ